MRIALFWSFEYLIFGFVSDFDIRISILFQLIANPYRVGQ